MRFNLDFIHVQPLIRALPSNHHKYCMHTDIACTKSNSNSRSTNSEGRKKACNDGINNSSGEKGLHISKNKEESLEVARSGITLLQFCVKSCLNFQFHETEHSGVWAQQELLASKSS